MNVQGGFMKGLELSEKFYKEYGEPMLQENFSDILPYIAVGLAGSGSECYGYDDEISRDHDFEPGFCIFIPEEIFLDSKRAFELEKAYARLPKEYMGFKRNLYSAVGGNRHGIIKTGDFFETKTGSRNGNLTIGQWLTLPEYSLAEAVNGKVFCDNFGEFTETRRKLQHYPENIRLKKIAGNLLLMGQSGQYNFNRCIARGETAAAQLAIFDFVKSSINTLFLLNNKYMPYYKWCFRALREMGDNYKTIAETLEYLISSDNSPENAERKSKTIESICSDITEELKKQELTNSASAEMEQQAYVVNNTIKDNNIRNMHILSGV